MANTLTKLTGTLVFVQLNKPVACFDAAKGMEWKASVVVDEDTADTWNEQFPKQSAKVVKTSDFAGIYKVEAPHPDAKKQYIITVRKNTKLANGEGVPDIYQPKVLLEAEGRKDVTESVIPANGSTGIISLDIWESNKGPVARLKNVLVKDLIEFEGGSGASYNPGDEFGDDEPAEKPAEKTIKVTKPKAKTVTEDKASEGATTSTGEEDPF